MGQQGAGGLSKGGGGESKGGGTEIIRLSTGEEFKFKEESSI